MDAEIAGCIDEGGAPCEHAWAGGETEATAQSGWRPGGSWPPWARGRLHRRHPEMRTAKSTTAMIAV